MLPQNTLIGNDTALNLGLYSLSLANETDFKQYLLDTGYADSISRANTVWTQAREYYYGDTGTVTSRPHRTPVNNFAAEAVQVPQGLVPVFTSQSELDDWNDEISPNYLQYRPGSGSLNLLDVQAYLIDGGLLGIAAIGVQGEYAFCYVLRDS